MVSEDISASRSNEAVDHDKYLDIDAMDGQRDKLKTWSAREVS